MSRLVFSRPPPSRSATAEDEITVERVVRIPSAARLPLPAPTLRMERPDPALLALSRGEPETQPPANDAPGRILPAKDAPPDLLATEPLPFDVSGLDWDFDE